MEKTIGFIGLGNMGMAILKGMLQAGFAKPEQVIASRRDQSALEKVAEELGIRTTTDNKEVAAAADVLFLAVKPHVYDTVIGEVFQVVKDDAMIVNIAAGISIQDVETAFGKAMKVARAMPNTPSLVGEGMIGLCLNERVSAEEQNYMVELFGSLGKVEVIEEKLINAVIGVSGSSPAILYMVLEALADGAVKAGMPRKQAYTFASQAMIGSAKMVLETGEHPGKLKDDVCSPGGSTIEGVIAAEQSGLRASILAAVDATIAKAEAMQK